MHQYILDTKFAAEGLVSLIYNDSLTLQELIKQQSAALIRENRAASVLRRREGSALEGSSHGQLHSAYMQRTKLDQTISFLKTQIQDKRYSLGALAGALLQIAKQGVSSEYNDPKNWPTGRQVLGVDLRDIVLAGRNQAQHYEEPNDIRPKTAGVFTQLNLSLSSPLDPNAKINLAFEVISILGWQDYLQYENDMVSFLG